MSSSATDSTNRLDRPVDLARDHVLGPSGAPITLVEYGSYACPYCRSANDSIARVRDHFGDRLRYVFRHRPLTGSDIARRAAVLAERADDSGRFWDAHIALMTRSPTLTEDDLVAVAQDLRLPPPGSPAARATGQRAQQRMEADERSAAASGVRFTPTFFINSRRYDGAWDEAALGEALLGSLGHRVHAAALDFARWAPSTGVLLLLASLLAVLLSNSPLAAAFADFWQQPFGLALDDATFSMTLLQWVNDWLLSVFFLVVGLEIKREFTIGRLATRRSAALPIASAVGGMAVPALLYAALIPPGPWAAGWGVPMATDTAFAVALIAMLGPRVPVELRVFLTAASIVDDIGAIVVVALFYSGGLDLGYLAAAAGVLGLLVLLNRVGVYRAAPYGVLGLVLWACVHAGGLHATLAGVLLAFVVPTRPPPNLHALMAQAAGVFQAEARHTGEVLRHPLSEPALQALDAIHDRLESPASRLLRHIEPWSSYAVLPLFALANAGVALGGDVWGDHAALMGAIMAGLVLGKPIGLLLGAAVAVRLRVATKPAAYSWPQLAGAGALAGIGFTMSLFIAGQAFPVPADFAAAKIAVFAASVVSAGVGVLVLWRAGRAD